MALPRQRRCMLETDRDHGGAARRTALGRQWVCYGTLRKPARRRRPVAEHERDRQRAHELARDLNRAQNALAAAMTRLKRTVTAIDNWQDRIRSIGRSLERLRDKAPSPQRTRGIVLPDDEPNDDNGE